MLIALIARVGDTVDCAGYEGSRKGERICKQITLFNKPQTNCCWIQIPELWWCVPRGFGYTVFCAIAVHLVRIVSTCVQRDRGVVGYSVPVA